MEYKCSHSEVVRKGFIWTICFQPNAAGEALEEFIQSTLTTKEVIPINPKKSGGHTVEANRGDYVVSVKRDGEVVAQETMTLDENDQTVRIKLKKSCAVKIVTKWFVHVCL